MFENVKFLKESYDFGSYKCIRCVMVETVGFLPQNGWQSGRLYYDILLAQSGLEFFGLG